MCTIITNITFFFLSTFIIQSDAFSVVPSNNNNNPSQQLPFQNPSSPEEAIQNQLYYYKTNQLSNAYNCCSPSNQDATGGLQEFERQLRIPPYDLLIGHERSDVMLEIKPDGEFDKTSFVSKSNSDDVENDGDEDDTILDVSCCLVCIRPNRKGRKHYPVWFWWEMSLVPIDVDDDDDDIEDGLATTSPTTTNISKSDNRRKEKKWMVDCIMPDFDDLDFETQALSIEDFGDESDGDEDELTIYWDFDE